MVDQNLLTLFLAVTAVAVLIQTGIVVGFCLLSVRLNRQADQAMKAARKVLGPLQATAESLQTMTASIAELSSRTPELLRKLEQSWTRRAA